MSHDQPNVSHGEFTTQTMNPNPVNHKSQPRAAPKTCDRDMLRGYA